MSVTTKRQMEELICEYVHTLRGEERSGVKRLLTGELLENWEPECDWEELLRASVSAMNNGKLIKKAPAAPDRRSTAKNKAQVPVSGLCFFTAPAACAGGLNHLTISTRTARPK